MQRKMLPMAARVVRRGFFKPKFHYADFHRNFPTGKVVDTNHKSRGHKRWQIIKPWSFGKSRPTQITKVADTNHLDMSRCLRQSPWQVRDKGRNKFPTKSRTCRGHKSWKSATRFVSRTFMICVRDKSATLSGTCPGLCPEVGVMELGLYTASPPLPHSTTAVILASLQLLLARGSRSCRLSADSVITKTVVARC